MKSPILVKTHDFNVWILNHSQRFPKNLRYTYTARLENGCFEFQRRLVAANQLRGGLRRDQLELADAELACLKTLLRYTLDFQLLGVRQFEYASQCLDEIGRLLGAWLKVTNR